MKRVTPLPASKSSSLRIVAVIPNAPKKVENVSLMEYCSGQRQRFEAEELERETGMSRPRSTQVKGEESRRSHIPTVDPGLQPSNKHNVPTKHEGQHSDRKKALERLRYMEKESNDQDHYNLTIEKLKEIKASTPSLECPVPLENKRDTEYFSGTRTSKHRRKSKSKVEVVMLETEMDGLRVSTKMKRAGDPPPPPLVNAWSARLGSDLFARPNLDDDYDLQAAIRASVATQNAVVEIPPAFYEGAESKISFSEERVDTEPRREPRMMVWEPPRRSVPDCHRRGSVDSVYDEQVRQLSRNPEPPLEVNMQSTVAIDKGVEVWENLPSPCDEVCFSTGTAIDNKRNHNEKTKFKTDERFRVDSQLGTDSIGVDVNQNSYDRNETAEPTVQPDYNTDRDVSHRSRTRQRADSTATKPNSQTWEQPSSVHHQQFAATGTAVPDYPDVAKNNLTIPGDYIEKPKKIGRNCVQFPPHTPEMQAAISGELAKRRASRFNNSAEMSDLHAAEKKQHEEQVRKKREEAEAQILEGRRSRGDGKYVDRKLLRDVKSNECEESDNPETRIGKKDYKTNKGDEVEPKHKERKEKEKVHPGSTNLKESVMRHLNTGKENKSMAKESTRRSPTGDGKPVPRRTSTPNSSPDTVQKKPGGCDTRATAIFVFKTSTPQVAEAPPSDVSLLTEQMFNFVPLKPEDFEFKPSPPVHVPPAVEKRESTTRGDEANVKVQADDRDDDSPVSDASRLRELSDAFEKLQLARVADQNLISALLTRDQNKAAAVERAVSPPIGCSSPIVDNQSVDPYADIHEQVFHANQVHQHLSQYINTPNIPVQIPPPQYAPRYVQTGNQLYLQEYASEYNRHPQSQYVPLQYATTQLNAQHLQSAMVNPNEVPEQLSHVPMSHYKIRQTIPNYEPYIPAQPHPVQYAPSGYPQYVRNHNPRDVENISPEEFALKNQARNVPNKAPRSQVQYLPSVSPRSLPSPRESVDKLSPREYSPRSQVENQLAIGDNEKPQYLTNNHVHSINQFLPHAYVQENHAQIQQNHAQVQGLYAPNGNHGLLQHDPNSEGQNFDPVSLREHAPQNFAKKRLPYMPNRRNGQPQYLPNVEGVNYDQTLPSEHAQKNQAHDQSQVLSREYVLTNQGQNESQVPREYVPHGQGQPLCMQIEGQNVDHMSPRDYAIYSQDENQTMSGSHGINGQPQYVPNNQVQPSPRDYLPQNHVYQPMCMPNNPSQNADVFTPRQCIPTNSLRLGAPHHYVQTSQTAQPRFISPNYQNFHHALQYPNMLEVQTEEQFVDPQYFRKPVRVESAVPNPGQIPKLPKPPAGWIPTPDVQMEPPGEMTRQGYASTGQGLLRTYPFSPVLYSPMPDIVGPSQRYKMNYNTLNAPHPPFGSAPPGLSSDHVRNPSSVPRNGPMQP